MECRFLVQSIPIPNRVPEVETMSALMYESSGGPFSKEISSLEISTEISIEYSEEISTEISEGISTEISEEISTEIFEEISVEISTENGPPELSYLCACYSTSEF